MGAVKYTILLFGIIVLRVAENLLFAAELSSEDLPGLRLRVSKNGIENVITSAFEFATQFIPGTRLPNINEDAANVDIRLTNLSVTYVGIPNQDVRIIQDRGFSVSISDMEVEVIGLYEFEFDFGFFSTVKEGGIIIVLDDFELDLDFSFDSSSTVGSLPFGVDTDCDTDADVNVYFEGGWSQGFHIGSQLVKPIINHIVSDQICEGILKAIDDQNKKLELILPVHPGISIDLSFTQMPVFRYAYLETHHKGAVYLHGEAVEPTDYPAIIPDFPTHVAHMFYVYVTESMLNTFMQTAYQVDLLETSVVQRTRDVLPGTLLVWLDSACSMINICFNDLTADSSKIVIEIRPQEEPMIQLRPNNTVAVHANVLANAVREYDGERVALVDVYMVIDVVVTLESNGTHIKLNLRFDDIQATSELRLLSLPNLFNIREEFTKAISGVVRAQVKKLEKDILAPVPIPPIPGVELSKLEFIKTKFYDLLVVGTDMKLKPEDILEKFLLQRRVLG